MSLRTAKLDPVVDYLKLKQDRSKTDSPTPPPTGAVYESGYRGDIKQLFDALHQRVRTDDDFEDLRTKAASAGLPEKFISLLGSVLPGQREAAHDYLTALEEIIQTKSAFIDIVNPGKDLDFKARALLGFNNEGTLRGMLVDPENRHRLTALLGDKFTSPASSGPARGAHKPDANLGTYEA